MRLALQFYCRFVQVLYDPEILSENVYSKIDLHTMYENEKKKNTNLFAKYTLKQVVRLAERSKAPDSRFITLPS